MKALGYHGRKDVRVDNVPDPILMESDDIPLDKGLQFGMDQTHVQKYMPELLEHIREGRLLCIPLRGLRVLLFQ